MRKNKTLSGIFRLKQVLKMLHANFVTYQTQIKEGKQALNNNGISAENVDLAALMMTEEAAAAGQLEGASKALSKKEKRLMKQQR